MTRWTGLPIVAALALTLAGIPAAAADVTADEARKPASRPVSISIR